MQMNVTFDVAAMLAATLWPLVLMIVLLMYRKEIPRLTKSVLGRVTKLAFAGAEVQLAEVKSITPAWSGSSGGLDLRHQARATEINDSYVGTFMTQLRDAPMAEVAEVNLGQGQDWLSSRLYIMAILFARYKGVEALVFLDTAMGRTRRYVGWAGVDKIRWALAHQYPWFEAAYASAYHKLQGATVPGQNLAGGQRPSVRVTNRYGRMGTVYDPTDVRPGIDLLQEFLSEIQSPPQPPAVLQPINLAESEWVQLERKEPHDVDTYEHAEWIDSNDVAELLGDDLYHASIREGQLKALSPTKQYEAILSKSDQYIALVDEVGRFKGLLNRCAILGQAVTQLVDGYDTSSREKH
jgi:hypothetical protein